MSEHPSPDTVRPSDPETTPDAPGALTGLVVRSGTDLYEVECGGRRVLCHRRMKIKRNAGRVSDAIVIGDRVRLTLTADSETATIEEVLPRTRLLRRARFSKTPQSIAANVDQMLVVLAVDYPRFDSHTLDRFLVMAESSEIPPAIVINKIDLDTGPPDLDAALTVYESLGYPVHRCSALGGEGLEPIRDLLRERITVVSGPSGVGKSSLLNAVQPGLRLRTGEVSEWSRKGRHTTTEFRLLALDIGGYVADTPGIKTITLHDVDIGRLDECFREIAPLLGECRFDDCSHVHEPGCRVRQAVDDGLVTASRYESYVRLRSSA